MLNTNRKEQIVNASYLGELVPKRFYHLALLHRTSGANTHHGLAVVN
jgi:hypothetical protein